MTIRSRTLLNSLGIAFLVLSAAVVSSPHLDPALTLGLRLADLALGRRGSDNLWLGLGFLLDVLFWWGVSYVVLSLPQILRRPSAA